jgi:hypothetical protein
MPDYQKSWHLLSSSPLLPFSSSPLLLFSSSPPLLLSPSPLLLLHPSPLLPFSSSPLLLFSSSPLLPFSLGMGKQKKAARKRSLFIYEFQLKLISQVFCLNIVCFSGLSVFFDKFNDSHRSAITASKAVFDDT